jgi:DNA-binding MurR/RpiR family transcriptional regulator
MVALRIDERRNELTPAERRIADVVLSHPQAVAFGTVADVARQADTSGATVVRFAMKLGFSGFSSLQEEVQGELAHRLRPAAERIRDRQPSEVVARSMSLELDNVQGTLEGVDRERFGEAVAHLSDRKAKVFVLAGVSVRGIGMVLADDLAMLRPGVELITGGDVEAARRLADVERTDVLIVCDFRRYERWVLQASARVRELGCYVVSLTDSTLSPLADLSDATFVVQAQGTGPFDSHVGTLAIVNTLVAGVAVKVQASATARLDRIEAAWRDDASLIDR